MEYRELDHLLEEAAATGGLPALSARLARIQDSEIGPDLRAYRLVIQGAECLHRGALIEGEDLLKQAVASLPEDAAVGIRGSAAASFGLLALLRQAHDEARELFLRAEQLFGKAHNPWKQASVKLNRGINELSAGKGAEGLELLEAVEAQIEGATVPEHWRAARRSDLLVNRAAAHEMLNKPELARRDLKAAYELIGSLDDDMRKGRIALNLSLMYRDERRFGSALDAAALARDCFAGCQAWDDSHRSATVMASACVGLGRAEEAERILDELPELDSGDELVPLWFYESQAVRSSLLRQLEDTAGANAVDEQRAATKRAGLGSVELHLLDQLGSSFMRAIDAASGFTADQRDEMAALIERLRSSQHPKAQVGARLMELFLEAWDQGSLSPSALTEVADLERSIPGPDNEAVRAVHQAIALRSRDRARLVDIALLDLHQLQVEASRQEGEAYRSQLYRGRSRGDLRQVLRAAADRNDSLMAEVIELAKTDPSLWAPPQTGADHPGFRELADPRSVAEPVLDHPRLCSVSGRSHLAELLGAEEADVDLDSVRERWGGKDALWWSSTYFEGALYWSLLTADGPESGAISVTTELRAALELHARCQPTPLQIDRELAARHPEWCVSLVALSRAAGSPAIDDPELVQSSLRAMPDDLSRSVRQGCAIPNSLEFDEACRRLGQGLVPEPLRERLHSRPGSPLLISTAPELATLPYGLLEHSPGETLLESGPLIAMPPVAVAGRAATSGRLTPRPYNLAINNPTGDLTAHRTDRPRAARELGDWGRSGLPVSVATRDTLIERLSADVTAGVISYVGHIRPGTVSQPGSAALMLAGQRPQDPRVAFSSNELLNSVETISDLVYLGACEGAGFGTGFEWASLAAGFLAKGSPLVVAHAWPIIDALKAAAVDDTVIDTLLTATNPATAVREHQLDWLDDWRRQPRDAIGPHWWAGLQIIGRAA